MSVVIRRCWACTFHCLPSKMRGDVCESCFRALNTFWACVERKAEAKMLSTGKPEGAHYVAAIEIIAEMQRAAE